MTVGSGDPLVYGTNQQNGGCCGDGFLVQGCLAKRAALIFRHILEYCSIAIVVFVDTWWQVSDVSGNYINLQGKQGAGRRCGAQAASGGNSLGSPQKLGNFAER